MDSPYGLRGTAMHYPERTKDGWDQDNGVMEAAGQPHQLLDLSDKKEISSIGCVAAEPEIGKIIELRYGLDIFSSEKLRSSDE
ncbi:hypothetical protein TNCV_1673821 [Trichonephila clavipes]|nr:hypothetical protein TNCV_1673821 [Trichonephila clavipes]